MKKLIGLLMAVCVVCVLSFGSVGCGKKEEKKDTPAADAKDKDKDKDKDKK